MDVLANVNYQRIASAIEFIEANYQRQPSLDEVAEHVCLSPYHFQRLFTDWAGTSPKKFLQYISLENAKRILKDSQATLFDTAESIGLSGTSRLHDLFVTTEGMTPAEYKQGGRNLSINYSFYPTPFGSVIIASTPKGICHMAFCENETAGFEGLRVRFPNASFGALADGHQQKALHIFRNDWSQLHQVRLHLKGTAFQLKVWEALLKIPVGGLSTYGTIAKKIGLASASRAVGTAIGSNPVAILIPCHRVIQSTGTFGNYLWGRTRKTAIIAWEQCSMSATN